ncbi:hypothetical protein HanRHA438_Chr04g0168781 [Helianthus annuus]|nr:hypothetical protein HanIR_Chr04g0171191 [Helianthus annuus]KAJ0742071.1 hypothetical protein HanOQP8_Chr06g0235361 [Helianthus annuus]KAJ0926240.1 hypothetical protein HanRHA438_Chr04g0168781 [Helianthus annuus]
MRLRIHRNFLLYVYMMFYLDTFGLHYGMFYRTMGGEIAFKQRNHSPQSNKL